MGTEKGEILCIYMGDTEDNTDILHNVSDHPITTILAQHRSEEKETDLYVFDLTGKIIWLVN